MAKQTKAAGRRSGSKVGGAGMLLLGVLLGVVLCAVGIAAYFRFGHPPVAVTDAAALWEPLMNAPVNARAEAEAKQAPFSESEDAFEGGAKTYRAQCAVCHGVPGHEAAVGRTMLPRAQQFFGRDRKSTALQSPGELYWKTAFGIRHSGMPAYNKALSDTQLWQVSLLLHASADELPDPVRSILTSGVAAPAPSVVKP